MATLSPDSARNADLRDEPLPYSDRIEAWRANREASLKKEGGWLSVVGLHWLEEGGNRIGAGTSNDFVLPAGSAPDTVGVITLHHGKITLKVSPGVGLKVNGTPVTDADIQSDAAGKPDRVTIGGLAFTVIQRGKRIGIRLWDNNAPARMGFTGLKWFPLDEAYRIAAKFMPYSVPEKVRIANILGEMEEATVPGYVTFTLHGRDYRLETQDEGDSLFINFKDLTNGDTTYPPGRFLYASKPENGQVILDFNQAYNPPCAFTAFATCALPPPGNFLEVAIPAGERRYRGDEDFVPAGQEIEYAADVAAMVKADTKNPPRKGMILFFGSGIIREWMHLPEQLAPLPVLNRGFGGARTWETLHYESV